MPTLRGYGCFRIRIACEIIVLLAGVGFCGRLAVSRCSEAALLHDGQQDKAAKALLAFSASHSYELAFTAHMMAVVVLRNR